MKTVTQFPLPMNNSKFETTNDEMYSGERFLLWGISFHEPLSADDHYIGHLIGRVCMHDKAFTTGKNRENALKSLERR